jgi:hypothetical protein
MLALNEIELKQTRFYQEIAEEEQQIGGNYSVPLFEKDDCMDARGTEPWMVKVDCARSWQSRATHGAVAEGLGKILLDKSPSIPLFQRGR